jgi:uncharacterized protein YnzC (UPF0291/DUF896 family)
MLYGICYEEAQDMSDNMTQLIARINELARKAKKLELTEAEIAERVELRHHYLQLFRSSMKLELDQIEFTDEPK